jgi:tetratricopeptide (TPR) repeat protein
MRSVYKGIVETVGIFLVLGAINLMAAFVIWVAGLWVLEYIFGVTGTLSKVIWALISVLIIVLADVVAFKRLSRKSVYRETAVRSFFELFEKQAVEDMMRRLKNLPAFKFSHYLLFSALFILAAITVGMQINYGFLISPVFIILMLYLWYSRSRSVRLIAAFYSGNALIARGRAQDALYVAESMLRIRPRSTGGHWLKGNSLFALRRYDSAILSYENAIRYNPTARRFLLGFVGLAFQRLGLLPKAIEVYNEALALNPTAKEVHYGLACAHSLRGETETALAHLEIAVRLGYDDRRHIESDPDLDNIRDEARYQTLLSFMR